MTRPTWLSRRTLLRGLGTAVALPWLEAMAPAADGPGASAKASPRRMAFFYVPNGVHMPAWTPAQEGTAFELSPTLASLQPFRDKLLVLSSLAQDHAFPHADGAGDHARSLSCFLTGAHVLKTDGANIHVGVSADQVAAQKLGRVTPFASLELGIDRGAQSGNCDSGYSCAYSSNISWRSPTTPMAKEVNPRLVFERLFASRSQPGSGSDTAPARARRDLYRKSILDFVADDAARLRDRLGNADRRKLDEYLTAVREVEQRVAAMGSAAGAGPGAGGSDVPGSFHKPGGIPSDNKAHIRLMCDLMVLAFQGDLTRIITFMYANEGSNRSYAFIGVPEGHHDLSHHGGDKAKQAKLAKINAYHIEQLAYFLGKLDAVREGDGTLLDHAMIVYGSGISDGNAHNHDELPILLAGRASGTIKPGRHLRYKRGTPLNNLYLSMLDRMGTPIDSLGDSAGRLPKLDG